TIFQIRDQQEEGELDELNGLNLFRIPFVDYARGDGVAIGPNQAITWAEPRLLDPTPGWALNYRGLWGLYTRDPFSGENAPAGPLYNRDGTMRQAWYDPLGWSGLDKVLPPHQALDAIYKQQHDIDMRQREVTKTIQQKSQLLTGLALETSATQGRTHLKQIHSERRDALKRLTDELSQLRRQQASDQALLEALKQYGHQLQSGKRAPIRAHIRHPHVPASTAEIRFGRISETWAALSIGLLMISTVLIFIFSNQYFVTGVIAMLALFIFIEAGARRKLVNLITNSTNLLATITALILFYEFFWAIVMSLVLLAGIYVIWDNVREL
ncbi:MAG: hypothetical protein AAF629_21720, partial [Chloroflexota bacterium]